MPARSDTLTAAGLVLLVLLAVQLGGGLRWPWLAGLQADDVYKQLSGFVLCAFIVYQWRLSLARASGRLQGTSRLTDLHKMIGLSAPVLFFMHTQSLGYAYQVALSLVFLALFLSGVFHREALGIPNPGYRTAWIAAHVGLATALPILLGYHVYITYTFE
jgi:hypothetical protein